ncbi:MAG TPA: hypothetical protein VGD56_21505, partial [Gemmatirosa sp.]
MSLAQPATAPAHAGAGVPAYGLTPPTEVDFHVALRRQVGASAADTVWDGACRACGLGGYARGHTLDDLERVAAYLMEQPGAIGIVGRSMRIRLRAYAGLSRRAA